MPEQEALAVPGFNVRDHGLWRRLVDDTGTIIHTTWMRAVAEGQFVGTCRNCGGFLLPSAPEQVGERRVDYEAQCQRHECGRVMLAANGKVLKGSGRRTERPRS